jgi:hypothetical protein
MRTNSYDAESWVYLSALLGREEAIIGFTSFIEILEFRLFVARIGFTARTTASGKVLCGKGWGGYVHLDKLGHVLGQLDAWRDDRVRRHVQTNVETAIEAFVSMIVATGDAMKAAALDVLDDLEARTHQVVDTVTRAREILRAAGAKEIEAQAAVDATRLGDVTHAANADASKASLDGVRRLAASARETIRDALDTLSTPQAALQRLLDDSVIAAEWQRVVAEAAQARLPVEEVRKRLEAMQPWHLTVWQEHADKRECFQRMNRQLVVARQLGTAGRVA